MPVFFFLTLGGGGSATWTPPFADSGLCVCVCVYCSLSCRGRVFFPCLAAYYLYWLRVRLLPSAGLSFFPYACLGDCPGWGNGVHPLCATRCALRVVTPLSFRTTCARPWVTAAWWVIGSARLPDHATATAPLRSARTYPACQRFGDGQQHDRLLRLCRGPFFCLFRAAPVHTFLCCHAG